MEYKSSTVGSDDAKSLLSRAATVGLWIVPLVGIFSSTNVLYSSLMVTISSEEAGFVPTPPLTIGLARLGCGWVLPCSNSRCSLVGTV